MARSLKLAAQGLALAAVAGLLGLLIWDVAHKSSAGAAQQLAKHEIVVAPGWTLPRLDREGTLALASLRGRVAVLNFWASWCLGCKAEAKTLAEASREWGPRGVVFVGIDANDFERSAHKFMRRYAVPYAVVRDASGSTLGRYGVTGFPETFFVRPNGKLVDVHIEGAASRAQIDEGIKRALES